MTTPKSHPETTFKDSGLSEPILKALTEVGYESPSPIQARTIPHILAGTDVLGQAQTGTGKTAAFALPLLSKLDLKNTAPQVLVLTPTRELAIQVAEAFQKYAAHMKGFHVLPIYGGQDYYSQLQQLRRGPHVVVGTPGRVMDHIAQEHAAARLAAMPGAGRGGRDAAHGLHRRRGVDPGADAFGPPDRALLGHHAAGHPAHRPEVPEFPRDHQHREQDHHGGEHPPALLAGERHP